MLKAKHPTVSELSPARQYLADLQSHRADKLADVTAETTAANRLNGIHEAIEPARAALADFDAAAALAYASWARGNVTGRPKPTTSSSQRDALDRALADAKQSSDAAKVAQAEFQANAEAASGALRGLDKQILAASKLVAAEVATKLLQPMAEATATAETFRHRLDAARAEIAAGIEWGSTEFNEVGAALHNFDNARGLAQARPVLMTEPFATEWCKFSTALAQDAEIDFDDAQKMAAAPLTTNPLAIDPATAAMLAVAAFPTL
jgi:hypothetical protein